MTGAVEHEDEFAALYRSLIAKRGGADAFDDVQLVLARRVVRDLINDGDLRSINETLAQLPSIVKREAREVEVVPTEPDEPWRLDLLSGLQLEMLEHLEAVAHGRAAPFVSERIESAINLARLVSGARDEEALLPCSAGSVENSIAHHVRGILRGSEFIVENVFRHTGGGPSAEQVANLKLKVEQLEKDLHMAQSRASGQVTDLAAARVVRP
jgi:hypothetical protein